MERPEPPVSRDAALAWARHGAGDQYVVKEVPHQGFNTDLEAGGFAFAESDHRFHIVGRDGSYEVRVGGAPEEWPGWIESFWASSRHRNRRLGLEDLGVWQRAAAAAATARSATVEALPAGARRGLDTAADLGYAEYLLILVNRSLSRTKKYDEAAAIRVLASDDALMTPPHESAWTRPCPICGLPAIGSLRYPRSVCDTCYAKTVDSHGRRVTGYNTSLSGGFEAAYVGAGGESEGICQEVTDSGCCWIEGHECAMGEARFGGVVVQLAGSPDG